MDMIILKRNDMLSEYFSNIIGSILGIPVLYNLDETCYLIPYFFTQIDVNMLWCPKLLVYIMYQLKWACENYMIDNNYTV